MTRSWAERILPFLCVLAAVRLCSATTVQFADKIHVGGLVGFVFYIQNQDKAGNALDPYYDIHPVYLNTNATISDHVSAFVEVEYEHSPQFKSGVAKGELYLSRAFIEVSFRDEAKITFGTFHTNFGPWSERHWRVITPTFERPISFENQYVPARQLGVQFSGRKAFGETASLTYDFWNSLGNEFHGPNARKGTDLTHFGFQLISGIKSYEIGVAGYTQVNPDKKDRREYHVNLFGSAKLGDRTRVRTEYTVGDFRNGDDGTRYDGVQTFFADVEYEIVTNWFVYYRFDTGNDEKRTGYTGSKSKTTIHSAAFTWKPLPGFRAKAEYGWFDFKEKDLADYWKFLASLGLVF